MSDLPLGKILLVAVFIFVLLKTTVVLMWTVVAAATMYAISLIKKSDRFART